MREREGGETDSEMDAYIFRGIELKGELARGGKGCIELKGE